MRSGSGIRTLADLRGKRVSSPQSGTEVIAERLLTAAGLDPGDDIERQRLSLDKSVETMKDGSIDALFWSGGLPTPGIQDLFRTRKSGVRMLDLEPLRAKLVQKYGKVYEAGEIGADVYGGKASSSTKVQNVLFVKKGFDATSPRSSCSCCSTTSATSRR